jgi:sister chromatid cohesion protein PDS5
MWDGVAEWEYLSGEEAEREKELTASAKKVRVQDSDEEDASSEELHLAVKADAAPELDDDEVEEVVTPPRSNGRNAKLRSSASKSSPKKSSPRKAPTPKTKVVPSKVVKSKAKSELMKGKGKTPVSAAKVGVQEAGRKKGATAAKGKGKGKGKQSKVKDIFDMDESE